MFITLFQKIIVSVLVVGALMFLFHTLYKKSVQPAGNYIAGKLYNLSDSANDVLKPGATDEDSFLFYLQKGFTTFQAGKWDSAQLHFVMAQKLKPKAALVYSVLCQTQIELRKYDDAIANAKHAIKLKPDYTAAKYFLEVAEKRKGGIEDWN